MNALPAPPTHLFCTQTTLNNMRRGQTSAVATEKGKWVWQEDAKQLVFEREGKCSRRKSRPWFPAPSPTKVTRLLTTATKPREDEDRRVTLEDVKGVAVGLISTPLVQKMHRNTTMLFDACYRTEHMNAFLLATLFYFNAFLKHDQAETDENVTVPGVLGESAREVLRKTQQELAQAKVNLGEAYSFLILGLGHRNSHHTQQGRLKVSRTLTDQDLYEVIYEFTMYVTWVTFSYQHWETIHRELGRLFRTPAFNRDMQVSAKDTHIEVEGLGPISRDSDEYLSYRIYYDRPAVGSLHQMHSPSLVNYFPSPKEKHSWVFEPPYKPTRPQLQPRLLPHTESLPERLGIIGELMSRLEPDTLKYYVDSEKQSENESDESSEGSSGEDSDTSDIQEDKSSESVNVS